MVAVSSILEPALGSQALPGSLTLELAQREEVIPLLPTLLLSKIYKCVGVKCGPLWTCRS